MNMPHSTYLASLLPSEMHQQSSALSSLSRLTGLPCNPLHNHNMKTCLPLQEELEAERSAGQQAAEAHATAAAELDARLAAGEAAAAQQAAELAGAGRQVEMLQEAMQQSTQALTAAAVRAIKRMFVRQVCFSTAMFLMVVVLCPTKGALPEGEVDATR